MEFVLKEKIRNIIDKFPDRIILSEILNENIGKEILPEEFNIMLNKIISNAYETSEISSNYYDLDIIYQLSWEHINKGLFKDVPLIWRTIFAISCLLLVYLYLKDLLGRKIEIDIIKKSLYLCDMSLMMGGEIRKDWNISSLIASEIHSIIVQLKGIDSLNEDYFSRIENFIPNEFIPLELQENVQPLVRISCPSITEFLEVMKKACPVILTNVIDNWPALSTNKWSVDYIRKVCGFRTVPIEIGSTYADSDWSQRLLTINEFVKIYFSETKNTEKAYLAQHYLFSQITELFDDICIPDYCFLNLNEDNTEIDINGWFGPSGTVSPLHQDPKTNLLCQVFGEKYVKLFSEDQTDYLYPYSLTMLKNTSKIDVFKPDIECFPLFTKAKGYEGILKPGEVLFIPSKCWHYVKSLSPSFSVNFWWDTVSIK